VPSASIIICAYSDQRWPDLNRLIESLRVQTLVPNEIILVIDHNDRLLARAQAAFTDIAVAPNRFGQGASGGRNTGFELSSGEILVLLDDDTVADPTWLENLLRPLSDETVLGTGGYLEPLWEGTKPAWLSGEFNWVVGCSYTGLPTTESRIRNPISANMSVRREVFERAGGFEQALSRLDTGGVVTGTAEETEFCIRALRALPGSSWMFVPDARVMHIVPESRTTWTFYRQRCRLEGASKAILTELAGPSDGLSSERAYLTSVLPRAVVRELSMAFRGNLDGFRRAGAIVAGLVYTVSAYARVKMQMAIGHRSRPTPSVTKIQA